MLLVMLVVNAKITNKLINKSIYYEFNIKTTQFYNSNYKSTLISKMLKIQLQNIQM